MFSACANSRLSAAGLLLVMAGCLLLPFLLNGQEDPSQKLNDQDASPQPSSVQLPVAAQAQLDKLEDALKAAVATGDAKAEAKTLNEIGEAYFNASDFQRAMGSYNQALALARSANDDIRQAGALIGVARCYRGQLQNEKALEPFQQALDLATASRDEPAQAAALNGIGNVYSYLGEKQRALEYFNQALPIERKAGDRRREFATLNNIGGAYHELGERQKALEYYNQALLITKDLRARAGQAATLSAIGQAYSDLGEKQRALEYFNQALPIQIEINYRAGEAVTLNGIGQVYYDLAQGQRALDYFNQALSMDRQMNNRPGEAGILINIGLVYLGRRESQKSLDYDNQALQIYRQIDSGLGQAKALNNIGAVYANLGEYQKALDYYNQALPIFQQRNYRRGEANTLKNVGNMNAKLGDQKSALENYNQALALAAIVNDPLLESKILILLMENQKASQPGLAVFYGKQAINLLQQVRGNIQGLDEDLQNSFLTSYKSYYRALADLLIAQGRLPEAEQVLNLEKQQEYSDYLGGEAAAPLSPLAITPAEKQAEEDYQKSTTALVSAGAQWAELKKNTARTAEQEKQFKELSDQLAQASKGLDVFYSRLYGLFGKTTSANNQVRDVKGPVSDLKQIIAEMPHTVALYTVVSTDRTSIIVIAGSEDVPAVVRESAISEVELDKKVAAFQQVLRKPGLDPKPLAQELYKILIGPVKADLDQAKAETLVWSLDGVLRYLPMAALYDGKQYMVENYNTVAITPASIAHLADQPNLSNMSMAAMGISQKYEKELPALPAVAGELDDVVKGARIQGANGALAGTILLNGQFTEKAMEDQLGGHPMVVHIASHFVYSPAGDASKSYLLMAGKDGNSFHLTVDDFRDDVNLSLSKTDLLTLSACETGMSGSAANGREIDGLGTTAQLKGAKAVISSLWEVDDASTGQLMGDFYKRWVEGAGKVTKVEALRQAQLDLLLGNAKTQGDGSDRGASRSKPASPAPAGYAHPYYWAPFVLMGNWR